MRSGAYWASIVARVTITLILLGYLGSKVNWGKMARQLHEADVSWLMLACLLFGLSFAFAGVRWWLLLRIQMIKLPLRLVMALTFVGQFFNSFLLGSTGGDVVRAFYAVKYSPQNRTHAMLSIIVDRAMGLFVVLSFALIGLWKQFAPVRGGDAFWTIQTALLWLFVLGVAAVVSFLAVPFERFPASLRRLWVKVPRRHNFELLVVGLRRHAKAPFCTVGALICSFAVQLVVFCAGYGIARAIGMQATFDQIVVVLAVVTCIVSLPISIGGHGVREGAFVLLFAGLGILPIETSVSGHDAAILFSVLFFALLAVWSLIGGVVYLSFKRSQQSVIGHAG